jgi:PAS domain S-box-containing protein
MNPDKILIVEDEAIVAMDLRLHLQALGYEAVGMAATGEQAVRLAGEHQPDLALMDVSLGEGMDGIEAARRIQALGVPVVFLTAYADEGTLKRAKESGPYGFLVKPFDERALHSTIEMALLRHRLERELKASESRFRALIENTQDLVAILDAKGAIRYASPSALRGLGYRSGERIGLSVFDLVRPEERPNLLEQFQALENHPGMLVAVEAHGLHEEGTWRLLEITAQNALDVPGVQGIIIHARDITERRQAEQDRRAMESKIQQAQKLESLGVLAGGIAHDFNNLLMGILGHAGLALMEMADDNPLKRRMLQIEVAATRAAELTNQLLAYSGKGRFLVEALSLSKAVEEMGGLLETVISKKATLEYRFAPDLPPIEGDPTQIRQVIMNLITNASDALGGRSGRIRITTGLMPSGPATLALAGTAPEGPAVFLEVSDTGEGMDETTLQRIFDPFFTTKFTGRGLGLAAALGIMRGHHGAIQVESRPGEGTTFRLLFPAAAATPAFEAVSWTGPQPYFGSGTILVVDDEENVRSVAATSLERCGFTVVTACHGREGLERFNATPEGIRAVILDLTMPEMGGEEVLAALRAGGGPGATVPVLISSGYSTADLAPELQRHGHVSFLQKPYGPKELIRHIRECLGE